jgi:transposase
MDTTLVAAPATPADQDDPTIWRTDDVLWALLAPLLEVDQPRTKPGRPRRADRAILDGLIWLARPGRQGAALPRECGPQSTVHRRLTEWVATGARARAWAVLLREDDGASGLEWTWPAADGGIGKTPVGTKGGPATPRPPAPTRPTGASPAPRATT